MESSEIDWTVAYVVVLSAALVGLFLTLLLSFRDLNVRESAVQYVMHSLCRAYFLYSACRWTFYVGVLSNWNGVRDYLDGIENGQMIGVRIVYGPQSERKGRELIVIIALLGDITLFCTIFWVIIMAFEMKRLIAKSMDRGAEKERVIMRHYNIWTYGTAIVFASTMVLSAWLFPGQERTVRIVAFGAQLLCVWISLVYPLYCTVFLSIQKRTLSVVNPAARMLHQRIKRFVIVYIVLVFPATLIESLFKVDVYIPILCVGISQLLYYFSGAGVAFVVGASLTCCYRTLQPIMPTSVYEHLLENGYFPEEVLFDPNMIVEPPTERPIFVCTDIEGSTAMWATVPDAMSEAQSLHDDLLRRQLIRFRGYEITTCGDAFQLAFHNVSDAIAWCIDVQDRLLKVHWPAELVKNDTTERTYDVWGRLVSSGLRIRMAIHAGDDKLICSKHPTTGKMTYLGVSEIVAREMGDMGRGGEIYISDSALRSYLELEKNAVEHKVHESFVTERLDEPFNSPELQISFPIHRVVSHQMGDRLKREKENRTDLMAPRLVLGRRQCSK